MIVSRETFPATTVSRETTAKLRAFEELLLRWNRQVNLISARDESRIGNRHIVDSLGLTAFIGPSVDRAIDMGAGAGFPGLVLAIATGIHFDLIESDKRKAAFLTEAGRLTAAPISVHSTRIEACTCLPAPLITSRALAPLRKLLNLAQPHLKEGGVCLFPKSSAIQSELDDARKAWGLTVEMHPNPNNRDTTILVVSQISRL